MRSIRNVGFCVVMLLFVIGAQRGVFASRLLADNYYSNEFLNTHPECDNQDFVEFWVLVINYPPVWNGFYYACDDVNENGCWDEPWAYWDARWSCEMGCADENMSYSFSHGLCEGECECVL